MDIKAYHQPVMLNEAINGLAIQPCGIYVDATFGGGGHSAAILQKLGNGRLIAFDRDISAFTPKPKDVRITAISQNFRYLDRFLKLNGIETIDGLLADLGVSSYQIDNAERGFSIRYDAALDMRMDRRQDLTAARILGTYSEEKLHRIFVEYGEITNARTLAKVLVQFRKTLPLDTSGSLKSAVRKTIRGNPNRYLAQVFQALRIEVNDELDALKDLLSQAEKAIKPGGRLVMITFHSLEDRIVKHFIRTGRIETILDERITVNHISKLIPITKKPIVPDSMEIKENPRARSARLRIAEKMEKT